MRSLHSSRPRASSLASCLSWVLSCGLLGGIARAQPVVGITDGVGYPGKVAAIYSYQSSTSNVMAVQFDVQYDTARLRLLEVKPTSHSSGIAVKSARQAGGAERIVLYSLRDPMRVPGRIAFARLSFEVLPEVRTDSGPVTPFGIISAQTDATPAPDVTANAGVIYIQPVYRRTNGVVDFFLSSQTNSTYDIEATTNFVQWVTITNLTATNAFMDLVDGDATNYPHRFYRSMTVP